MSSEAQIAANRENAQHSTGPQTEAGKAASSQNNHRHGLAGGIFKVLPWEDQREYTELLASLLFQHQPKTPFEEMLVQKIAQHFWLSQRALKLQDGCFELDLPLSKDDPALKLYLRYQAAHDRAYHKLSDELRKLRNDKRKEAIGFESQKQREASETRRAATQEHRQNEEIRRTAAESRRESAENRKTEIHSKRLALFNAQIHRLATRKPATPSEPNTPYTRCEAA